MASRKPKQEGQPAAQDGASSKSQPAAPETQGKRRARKRADGEGSIYFDAKAGLWRASLMVGHKPVTLPGGKVVQRPDRRLVSAKTQKECRAKLDALKGEVAKGGLMAPSKLTVDGLLDQWLADCKVRGLRPKSLFGYEQCSRLYLKPVLGATRLAALRPDHVRTALAGLAERGISSATVRKARVILHAALQLAVRTELVGRNVADAVQPPRLARRELRPPTPAEATTLMDTAAAAQDPLEAFFVLALYTGCRPGEVLALKWADLDWDAGKLHVRRNLTDVRKQAATLAEPKTSRGRRVLTLPAEPLAALRAHRARQAEDRLLLGPDYQDGDLVFCTRTGTPLLESNVVRSFKRLLVRAGLPAAIRLYDLRHANATAMLVAGVHPKVASERLGHAGVTLFMDTYSHLLPELEAGAASALQGVFRQAKGNAGAG